MTDTSPRRPLGAQISHMLKSRGVDVIFGIPGVHNIEMYRGIEEAGITHVLARHEQGAGFMADGYARASGKPGLAYVITGPGLCNIMTPMGQAWSDSVPMLVLSSCLDETSARRGQLHQMINQQGAAATVCDWSVEARSAEATFALIDRALTEFDTARPRPRHIQVPIALGGTSCPPAPASPARPAARPGASVQQLGAVAARLRAARRPLFIFGGGAVGTARAAREVLARTRAASFTSYAGRGIVPAGDPLHFGSYLARPDSARALDRADLVVVVGSELAEVDLWRDELGCSSPMIRVDIDPVELGHPAPDMAILSDAGRFLSDLAAALPETGDSDWTQEEVRADIVRWRAEVDSETPGIVPVLDALRGAVPEDAMIFSDMTQSAYAALEVWPMTRPGHWHHPFGFGTLGYALPAAIGGAVARPGRPTLAIAGDYGFQYTLPELATAVELGLSLPIVIWDNAKLKAIEDAMVHAQIAPNAVVAQNPEFCALARAYGAHAAAPETLDDMRAAVTGAFAADRPTLIHVRSGIA